VKLFVDGVHTGQIRELLASGRVTGVIVQSGEGDLAARRVPLGPEAVREICGLLPGPVIVDAGGGDRERLIANARQLAAIATNVIVRLPMSVDGMDAVRVTAADGGRVSVGPCTSPVQAVMAAKAGALFVEAPLGARAGNEGEERDQVRRMVANLRMYGLPTELVVGPVDSADEIVDVALVGAHVATASYAVLAALASGSPRGSAAGRPPASS